MPDKTSLIDGDVSAEEYASFWGADPCYDKPPRNPGDGYLFYNFSEEGHDPEFLRKFIPAIERTMKTVLPTEPDYAELAELKRICKERLTETASKKVKIEAVKSSFAVPLTDAQWEALNAKDDDGNEIHRVHHAYRSRPLQRLYEAGCENLDWNGHFGQYFFFDANTKDITRAKKAVTKFVLSLGD